MAPILNTTDVVDNFHIVSWTKDSISLRWSIPEKVLTHVSGYRIRYQALGSTVVQSTHTLDAHQNAYDITRLHENTNYEVCIHVLSANVSGLLTQDCIEASTTTDSLHVALGSTFGAFLALGIIVLFVFMAKWQHTRKLKKQLQQVTPSGDSYDSIVMADGEIEMSDVSLQQLAEDEKAAIEALALNGHQPHANDGIILAGGRRMSLAASEARKSSLATGGTSAQVPTSSAKLTYQTSDARPLPPPPRRHREGRSMSLRQKQQLSVGSEDGSEPWYILPPPPSGVTKAPPPDHNTHIPPDVRPKDVRPKVVRPKHAQPKETRSKSIKPSDIGQNEEALMDLTEACNNTNPHYTEVTIEPGATIRPNLSCNW